MNNQKDTDLREAMRRMYADTPQLPSDFMTRMHQAQEKENKRRTLRRWLYPTSIGVVAASLLLLFLFNHSGDQPKKQPLVAKHTTEATQPTNSGENKTVEGQQTETETVEQKTTAEHTVKEQVARHRPTKKAKKRNRTTPQVQQAEQHVALTEKPNQEGSPATDEPIIAPVHYSSPDPYLTMASQVEDIRTRGERLHKEVALLMDNL